MLNQIKIRSRIDVLKDRYEALVRDAHLLHSLNPTASRQKLFNAEKVRKQIEELKLAYLN